MNTSWATTRTSIPMAISRAAGRN